jgi:hypothetical protein
MEITYASQPGDPAIPNEDYVLATDRFVVLLDGATAAPGVDSGCVHDVVWLVGQLAGHLARCLTVAPAAPLREVLRSGIVATMASHGPACDLTNRDSPSSTVVLLRLGDDSVDWLVLGDSAAIVERRDGRLEVAHDDRTARLASYSREAVSAARNTDAGFWVASVEPSAADHALLGSVPRAQVSRVLLVTDGAGRLVERYGRGWLDALDLVDKHGPGRLIAEVRAGDAAAPAGTRGKRFDDATVVLCLPGRAD